MKPTEDALGALEGLSNELKGELAVHCNLQDIPAGHELLREGQFVKVIPIVISGLVKVFSRHEDKEFLLYYIKPTESCIMSFTAGLRNEPSNVFAATETDSRIMLLPASQLTRLLRLYPELNHLFHQEYAHRYGDLLETIHAILFNKLDQRLLDYLKHKVELTGMNPLFISHRQIARDLGTAREVISRVSKKLEHEGKLKQLKNGIELKL